MDSSIELLSYLSVDQQGTKSAHNIISTMNAITSAITGPLARQFVL